MGDFIKGKTGGRGTPEMQSLVNSLLKRYELHMGAITPPVRSSVFAKIQNARILFRQGSDHWVSSIMPMGNGFDIYVNEAFPMIRKRNAICHEVAHTFFYDIQSEPLKRLNKPRPDDEEELLCFWAAREMLVPTSLFENELDTLGVGAAYSLKGISNLAKTFQVSPDIIAYRLTHDLALLGKDWIILWYISSDKGRRYKAMSLYPEKISSSISKYYKMKILEAIQTTILKQPRKDNPIQIEFEVGKRLRFKFKVKTEYASGKNLFAISWVTPLEGLRM